MTPTVGIDEFELGFLEYFRIALSAQTIEDRLVAIRQVKHELNSERQRLLIDGKGPGWIDDPTNRELAAWIAKTSADRHDASYEFLRLSQQYEDKFERRLNVAEHVGKIIDNSIREDKFEGVQTPSGIVYQVTVAGKNHNIPGAKDKDRVRKNWMTYRGVVHLGIAMDLGEENNLSLTEVIQLAERLRRKFSEICPKGTKKPYVPSGEQISFSYQSKV